MKASRFKSTVFVALALALLAGSLWGGGVAASGRRKGAVASLTTADGASVGKVRFIPQEGVMLVRATATGLTAGWHGFHVHTTGTCDPNATDPATGQPSPFFTAGGHYNPDRDNDPQTTAVHGAHPGDMPPLLTMENGTAVLRFKTDRLRMADLFDEDGSAVIVHGGPDNLAHVPAKSAAGADRYHSHVDDVFGPDTLTRATGDAGARFACGEVERI